VSFSLHLPDGVGMRNLQLLSAR